LVLLFWSASGTEGLRLTQQATINQEQNVYAFKRNLLPQSIHSQLSLPEYFPAAA
jgi:hypothetical protein